MFKLAVAALLAATNVLPSAPAPAPAPHTFTSGWCFDSQVKVAPAPDTPRTWSVAFRFCRPWRWTNQVDILTHGATYTRTYWDWPQGGDQYSYVDRALADGRATLAYDRIGNGASTRPASSTEITMASDAYVLHQLVFLLRLLSFRHVASVSHSYGSGVALAEAAAYRDVSSVVVSGYLHRPSNPAVTAGNYPANQDPKFLGQGLDDGWLTSRPGVRGSAFHSPTSDPDVVAYDEVQKDLVSRTGLVDFISQRGVPANDNISNLVAVPVLVLVGEQDIIFCYQPAVFNCSDWVMVASNETPFYHDVTIKTIPLSGHDLTLHPSADQSYSAIDTFIRTN